jgi:uncharacterized OB-fold protein
MAHNDTPTEFAGFLDAARADKLAFPRCSSCGRFHWYPMPLCPHCQSDCVSWEPVAGPGEIFSFTEVRHAFDKGRIGYLPYVVGLVTFADAPGVRLITNIIDAMPADLRIGQKVLPVFSSDDTGAILVHFRLAPSEQDRA